jgi:hypothetical protein
MVMIQEFRSSGVQEFRSSGVQEFRSSGVQEFRSSGVQEFRSSGSVVTENCKKIEPHATQYATDPALSKPAPELLQLLNSSILR